MLCLPLLASIVCVVMNLATAGNAYALPSHLSSAEILGQESTHFACWLAMAVLVPLSMYKLLVWSADAHEKTAADYTVKVSGISHPEDLDALGEHMAQMLYDKHKVRPLIEAVLPTYKLGAVVQSERKLKQWHARLHKSRQLRSEQNSPSSFFENHRSQTQVGQPPGQSSLFKILRHPEATCREKVQCYENARQAAYNNLRSEARGHVAFVVFSRDVHARLFIETFQTAGLQQIVNFVNAKCKRNSTPTLIFKRPPHPEDVIFPNLAVSLTRRFLFQVQTGVISVGLHGFRIASTPPQPPLTTKQSQGSLSCSFSSTPP